MFNSSPNEIMLDCFKLKAFIDDISNVTQNIKFVLNGVENIVVGENNAGNRHFSNNVLKSLIVSGRKKS